MKKGGLSATPVGRGVDTWECLASKTVQVLGHTVMTTTPAVFVWTGPRNNTDDVNGTSNRSSPDHETTTAVPAS